MPDLLNLSSRACRAQLASIQINSALCSARTKETNLCGALLCAGTGMMGHRESASRDDQDSDDANKEDQ